MNHNALFYIKVIQVGQTHNQKKKEHSVPVTVLFFSGALPTPGFMILFVTCPSSVILIKSESVTILWFFL